MLIKKEPLSQLHRQIDSMYGITAEEKEALSSVYPAVLEKMEKCFSRISNKYYQRDREAYFDPLHTGQWTVFLYTAAHLLIRGSEKNRELCDKLYGLSKCVSSADIYYEVEMPEVWFFDHPQGSVMGRAEYGGYFAFSQGCTVGNSKGRYPKIGPYVVMYSDSKILGDCRIGDHVILSANAFIMDREIPSCSIDYGTHPDNRIVSLPLEKIEELQSAIFMIG